MRTSLALFAVLAVSSTACVPVGRDDTSHPVRLTDDAADASTDDTGVPGGPSPIDAGAMMPAMDAEPAMDAPLPPGTPRFSTDIVPILSANCYICHGRPTVAGAPMSLMSYDDLIAPAATNPRLMVHELVAQRVLRTDPDPMPKNGELTPAQIETLGTWSLAGAPQ